jgi:hypothetical protein
VSEEEEEEQEEEEEEEKEEEEEFTDFVLPAIATDSARQYKGFVSRKKYKQAS